MNHNLQIEMAHHLCDVENHEEGRINSLCLRVGCNSLPAQCDKCTQEKHKDCHSSILIDDVPKKLQPLQQEQVELIQMLQKMILQISEFIATIEQKLQPISQYIDHPNIVDLNNLGVLLKTQVQVVSIKEIEKAEKAIQTIFDEIKIKLPEVSIKSRSVQKWNLVGKALIELNKFDYALECSKQALTIDPNNVDALVIKGRILIFGFREYKKAIECSEQALKIDKYKTDALILKGTALYWQDKYDEALEQSYYALNIEQNMPDAWILKGRVLSALNLKLNKLNLRLNQSDCCSTLECCEKALLSDPLNSNALALKGLALLGSNKDEQALEYSEQALKINPFNQDAIDLQNLLPK